MITMTMIKTTEGIITKDTNDIKEITQETHITIKITIIIRTIKIASIDTNSGINKYFKFFL